MYTDNMVIYDRPANLLAGIDNLSLDKRNFTPSPEDINRLCIFFALGKLKHYKKENGIVISHSNFLVFVVTTRGQYALKFYPMDAAKKIAIEYAVNRFLIDHHFPTPVMYASHDGKPFLTCNARLATCFSYIDGLPVWQKIKQQKTIIQINSAMLDLKNILSTTQGRIPSLKQESLVATINALTQTSRALAPYDQKKMIDASLKDACQSYQQHQPLFTRQWLHNNATLTNFLINKETAYTLDLFHIRENYALSDLASLVISCLFLRIPKNTVKMIVNDYFTQHKTGPEYAPTLNTLIQIGLIREYLKNVRREKFVDFSTYPTNLMRTYLFHLSARKKSITAALRKMNGASMFIV